MKDVLFYVFGVIALVFSLIGLIFRDRRTIQINKIAMDVFWALNFLCGSVIGFTSMVQNCFAVFRDSVFLARINGRKWAQSRVWLFVFLVGLMIIPFVTFAGWFSFLPIVGSLSSTYAYYSKDAHLARLMVIPGATLSLIYAVIVGNVFSILANAFVLISSAIGLARERWIKAKEAKENSATCDA